MRRGSFGMGLSVSVSGRGEGDFLQDAQSAPRFETAAERSESISGLDYRGVCRAADRRAWEGILGLKSR
jgi:hypothetical protein